MINNTGFNFENIHDVVNAAENLQRGGKDEDARNILEDLAREILEAVGK